MKTEHTPDVVLVSPPTLYDPRDPFSTGIVYMPIGLAYGAAALRDAGYAVEVIDAFGERPDRAGLIGSMVMLGLSPDCVAKRVQGSRPMLVVVYANQLTNHDAVIEILRRIRFALPTAVVAVAENTQAVTAYQLMPVADELFSAGANLILAGEMEERIVAVCDALSRGVQPSQVDVDGVSTDLQRRVPLNRIVDLDVLPFPAWDLFPLTNYWSWGFSHGPLTSDRYLPLLTSRGCPYPCKFCVVPSTNQRKWRSRSAQNVEAEIRYWRELYDVCEFHVEDLNPTISDARMRELSELLIKAQPVIWKIVAGTKVESIKSAETLSAMASSGLRYLSMSPESGSPDLLKKIGKPFDVGHAMTIIRCAREHGVFTQACFVLGFPGESDRDRFKTLALILKMTWGGIDEIAVFIITPVPGSAIYAEYDGQFSSLSQLHFSPSWRRDFKILVFWRVLAYSLFLVTKFFRHPILMLHQARNLLRGSYQTKMEMVPRRGLKYLRLARSGRSGEKHD
jgi:anaerobic magnesium-protoporphyrin IX monomethyl ester cyclase